MVVEPYLSNWPYVPRISTWSIFYWQNLKVKLPSSSPPPPHLLSQAKDIYSKSKRYSLFRAEDIQWIDFSPFPHKLLSINALRARVYIYIRQLSSFRAPTLWFIDLTVATCHTQYTFLSLCQFFQEKTDKTGNTQKSAIFVWYENGRRRLRGAQSIGTESLTAMFLCPSET